MPGGLIMVGVTMTKRIRKELLSLQFFKIRTPTVIPASQYGLACIFDWWVSLEKPLLWGQACRVNYIHHLIDSLQEGLFLAVLSSNPHTKPHLLTDHSIFPSPTPELLNKHFLRLVPDCRLSKNPEHRIGYSLLKESSPSSTLYSRVL